MSALYMSLRRLVVLLLVPLAASLPCQRPAVSLGARSSASHKGLVHRVPRCPIAALRGGSASAAEDGGGGIVQSQWARYMRALDDNPLRTKMATGAVLAATGDLIAQLLEGSTSFALRRLLNLVAVNVLYVTPFLCATYAANEWAVGSKLRLGAGSTAGTAARLIFDQFVNAPIVVLGFFCSFGLVSALSAAAFAGEPFSLAALVSSVVIKLQNEYVGTMISNWKIWIPPQLVNFALMPPPLRVPFASLVALVWNVVLALVANR
mmetsp:Transcript_40838/g.135242  ORF Transcript_40838/g.135242 Transcript_40838/m.135242 type:complete len:264 (-) Transcript_40838:2375-3166(-)